METKCNLTGINPSFALCICTYKRVDLLEKLILDVLVQTLQPGILIIVDGDPSSGQVLQKLQMLRFPSKMAVHIIPSNHSNLAYQRYLGWKVASRLSYKYLVYLDDDLRPSELDTLRNLVKPLEAGERVTAVTANIMYSPIQMDSKDNGLIKLLGDSWRYRPGSVTATGNRIPVVFDGNDYVAVDCLSGGAMALLTAALSDRVFSRDLFSIYEKKIGKGEDTILSLRLKESRSFLFAFNSVFWHLDSQPIAYPTDGFKKGYAIAYSRRMINDNYRGFSHPLMSDRLALYKSYLGNILVNVLNILRVPDKFHFHFALGYLRGAVHGILAQPTTKALTPDIDWFNDSCNSVSKDVILQ